MSNNNEQVELSQQENINNSRNRIDVSPKQSASRRPLNLGVSKFGSEIGESKYYSEEMEESQSKKEYIF